MADTMCDERKSAENMSENNNTETVFLKALELFSFESSTNKLEHNFFDVAGFPHYENVVSNILAFFLNTREEHGFKDLWIRSLVECYYDKCKEENSYTCTEYATDDPVQREFLTQDGNRIDIVVPTNNNLVLVIENKIYSSVYNPFDEYHNSVEKAYKGNNLIEILLSLKKETDQTGEDYRFVNITYEHLLHKVRQKIGTYISGCNEKWLIYMNELMKNLDSLQGAVHMYTNELQQTIRDNGKQIRVFYEEMQNDIKGKYEFLKRARDRINDQLSRSDKEHDTIKAGVYGSNTLSTGYCSLFVDIPIDDDHTITYEPYFMKVPTDNDHEQGGILYLAIWDRVSKKIESDKVKSVFSGFEKTIEGSDWGKYVILKKYNFEEIDSNAFVDESLEVIRKIKTNWKRN